MPLRPDRSDRQPTDDVVTVSVASYSGDPISFAAYGADAVARPFGRFAALLPMNTLVLDAGCGPGRDLARLNALGHRAIGVDLNEDFIHLAHRTGPTIRADLRSLPLLSGSFDAVWASASLIHLAPEGVSTALDEFLRVAKEGAPIYISVKTGIVTGWAYDPPLGRRWFRNWTPMELTSLVERAGLSVETISDDGHWIEVVTRR